MNKKKLEVWKWILTAIAGFCMWVIWHFATGPEWLIFPLYAIFLFAFYSGVLAGVARMKK